MLNEAEYKELKATVKGWTRARLAQHGEAWPPVHGWRRKLLKEYENSHTGDNLNPCSGVRYTHFNKLQPGEHERLAVLSEELGAKVREQAATIQDLQEENDSLEQALQACTDLKNDTKRDLATARETVERLKRELREHEPRTFPMQCFLCEGQINSPDDYEWHGLGNCVPLCEACHGNGFIDAAKKGI